jgi:hypothetical protein
VSTNALEAQRQRNARLGPEDVKRLRGMVSESSPIVAPVAGRITLTAATEKHLSNCDKGDWTSRLFASTGQRFIRGLNANYNHDLKNIFKAAVIRALLLSTVSGILSRYHSAQTRRLRKAAEIQ